MLLVFLFDTFIFCQTSILDRKYEEKQQANSLTSPGTSRKSHIKMQRAICTICFDDLWAPNTQVVSYSCGHVFHVDCARQLR